MKSKLEAGGYGWGHAKKELLDALITNFAKERELFNYYMNNTKELDEKLAVGALKAKVIA